MQIIKNIKKLFGKNYRQDKINKLLKSNGCVCCCPNCKEPLTVGGYINSSEFKYVCEKCGKWSIFNFDIAPVPIMVDREDKEKGKEYKIEDWAGNTMFDGKTFKTYEDGWAYIYEHIDDKDNAYDDIFVVSKYEEKKIKRAVRG